MMLQPGLTVTKIFKELMPTKKKKKKKKRRKNQVPLPTVMHNVDDPIISPNEVLNIAPGERQLPILFILEPD